jgi:spore maturation protein CgeB
MCLAPITGAHCQLEIDGDRFGKRLGLHRPGEERFRVMNLSACASKQRSGMRSGSYTILAPGFAKWWGSDARALAQAFRKLGHTIIDIDEEDYVPLRWEGAPSRILRRLFMPVFIDDYNHSVLERASNSSYNFVLAYKGYFLKPETVKSLRDSGKPVFNFYPDVSFEDHGGNIPASLRHYDCVFTTKSYHGKREIDKFGIRNLLHVRHGFDPEVHRPVSLSDEMISYYGCDVSFVGCWSPEKESRLLYLLEHAPGVSLRVYGVGWKYASSEFKQRMGSNLKPGVFGDELSIVYCASKVNLGLLSSSSDRQLRDQTTARTFQIPATGSFMLHEDTPEIRRYFEPDREVMLFGSDKEMIEKIQRSLSSPSLRETIRMTGYERCHREPYDYLSAARAIVAYFENGARGASHSTHQNDLTNEFAMRLA